jgi:putative ABC transport system substrate-binding protein
MPGREGGPYLSLLVSRLRELGWTEGRNLVMVNRYAQNDPGRLEILARELAAEKVDVIHAMFPRAVSAVRKAAPGTPIVFSIVSDPVADGFVASLARPGGNITGATTREFELFTKRIQLLRELLPQAKRVAVLADAPPPEGMYPLLQRALEDLARTGERLGLRVETIYVSSVADVGPVFERIAREHVDGVLVLVASRVTGEARRVVVESAARTRLPAIYTGVEYVDYGGLMAYAVSPAEMARRAAEYVDKILRGAKPADLPVEEPNTFELVLNLKAARAQGIKIPQSVLLRANRVIE